MQIRAVDATGNTGAWSGTTTFVASEDNLPPSTPAAPSVAGSRIAVQVTHTLGKASGGTFNLESDLDHLEIHVSYEPTFTPDTTTLVGKAVANAGMIQAGIPVVFTAQVEETSARYVRVVAVDKTGNKSGPSDAATATALLIDDAHISDLTVTKVTAGTISADWIVGARIKTADTGARAEMSASGFEAYNSGGLRTFFADASTGDVSIVGQLVSGTSGKRLEINPTATLLPEIRFYPSSGTDYAYINSTSSGSDSNLGLNSSPYDDGGGTQVIARAYLHTTAGARLEIVTKVGEQRRGGYTVASPDFFFSGFIKDGVDGGRFSATESDSTVGWCPTDSTNGQFWRFTSGTTKHFGKWENFVTASSNQGLFTGSVVQAAITSLTLTYGPTMDSTMFPVVTCVASNYGTATPTVWGIQSQSTTGFTVAWNNSQGMRVNFWCFRA